MNTNRNTTNKMREQTWLGSRTFRQQKDTNSDERKLAVTDS